MTARLAEQAEYTLSFSPREVALLRVALTELLEIYTRHEHLFGDIHGLLKKLPPVSPELLAQEQ